MNCGTPEHAHQFNASIAELIQFPYTEGKTGGHIDQGFLERTIMNLQTSSKTSGPPIAMHAIRKATTDLTLLQSNSKYHECRGQIFIKVFSNPIFSERNRFVNERLCQRNPGSSIVPKLQDCTNYAKYSSWNEGDTKKSIKRKI
jgi:hypothetical protein